MLRLSDEFERIDEGPRGKVLFRDDLVLNFHRFLEHQFSVRNCPPTDLLRDSGTLSFAAFTKRIGARARSSVRAVVRVRAVGLGLDPFLEPCIR